MIVINKNEYDWKKFFEVAKAGKIVRLTILDVHTPIIKNNLKFI